MAVVTAGADRRGEPWSIIKTRVPQAPCEGQVLGVAVCEAGHTVLVIGDIDGDPVIEVHFDADNVDQVVAMLQIEHYLGRVRQLFDRRVKLTLIARHPDYPDGSRDLIISDDTLISAIGALTTELEKEAAAK